MKITKRHLRRIIREVSMNDMQMNAIHGMSPTPSAAASSEPAASAASGFSFPATCPSHACVWGENDDIDESDVETLEEDDELLSEDEDQDAFLDSMIEMWVDHFGAQGVSRIEVMQALNDVYLNLSNEY